MRPPLIIHGETTALCTEDPVLWWAGSLGLVIKHQGGVVELDPEDAKTLALAILDALR